MAKPAHACERSEDFFNRSFVGSSHGDDGTAYRVSWDSMHHDLRPTMVLSTGRGYICGHCGNAALPIQTKELENWPTIGHTCCCQGAFDERDYQDQLEELLARHKEELYDMRKKAPVPSEAAVKKMVKLHAEKIEKEATRYVRENFVCINGETTADHIVSLSEALAKVGA